MQQGNNLAWAQPDFREMRIAIIKCQSRLEDVKKSIFRDRLTFS
jgi:hypothetical protein